MFNAAIPQYRVEVNREKAKALGVPIGSVFATMQSTFGSLYVNDFTLFGRNYKVNLASEGNFRERPEDLRHVFVRADGGAMIPLDRSEEHTSELQSLMRISYAVFCLKKKINNKDK